MLAIVSAVFAVGLLLPPVGWTVTYLMGFCSPASASGSGSAADAGYSPAT